MNTQAKSDPKRRAKLSMAEMLFIGAGVLLILLGNLRDEASQPADAREA